MAGIKTVIFDLDGTLVDSAPDLMVACNRLLAEEGRREVTLDEIKLMVGDGVVRLVDRAFAATGEEAGDRLAGLAERYVGFYHGHGTEKTRPYPGVMEALEGLGRAGIAMGVATNKPFGPTMEILEAFGIAPFLGCVIGGDSLPGVKKPDPRLLLACIDGLRGDKDSSLMVGDGTNDVEAARAAGIPVFVHRFGYGKMAAERLGADRIFDHFTDLPTMIADW